jgi:NAD(P)-dependent dehydrogenase (short-subunit alcohol dehydrogenase family)
MLLPAGADLAITYTSKDCTTVADDISKQYSITCRAFKCDVGKSKEVNIMVDDVQRSFGKEVDIAVCNAGM